MLKYWKIISRFKKHTPEDYLRHLNPNHQKINFLLTKDDFRIIFRREKRKKIEITSKEYEMRQEFLIQRGELYTDLHTLSKEAAIKQIIQHEKSKKTQ